ncbi:MAG: response regulator transcription factor, partial [Geobacter sp.]|nr:response regulator transcription factor [Geobacter sp.]
MNDKISVIVVEDDPDLCETLVEFLTLSGMEVTGVNSGLEFYKVVAQRNFTVAVLDIGLPDQSGYVLAEYARRNYAMGIIMQTAHGEAEERLKGYESGADVYMIKPVDCRELASAIKNLSLRISGAGNDNSPLVDNNAWRLNTKSWILLT